VDRLQPSPAASARTAVKVVQATTMPLKKSEDVVLMRQAVREKAIAQGLSLVDQTKIVTAASELARNTLDYGRGGEVEIAQVVSGGRRGVRLVFTDKGPGIADIEAALRDGFTTGGGLGLGLGGAKRLSNEFSIQSKAGEGTRIEITRWQL
jgi:serine/threonine-protein kinase RsbT